jgi:hypothetical protein
MKNVTQENGKYTLRLDPEQYDLFAEYIRDAIKYLTARGCPPPAVLSLQNEPEGSPGWADNADELDETGVTVSKGIYYTGATLVQVLRKVRTTLNAAGLESVKLGAPESVSYLNSTIFNNMNVNTLREAYDIHMIHAYTETSYDNVSPDLTSEPLARFQALKNQLGKDSWETEYSVADENTTVMQRLMTAMQVFSSDMVHAGHNVWMWFLGWMSPTWTANDPRQYVLLGGGDGKTTVNKSRMFDAFAIIFNNVRPDSHVRKVTTTDPSVRTALHIKNGVVAFERAGGGTFIMLINNNTDKPKVYNLSGLAGQAGTLKTMEGHDAYVMKTSAFTVSDGTAEVLVPKNSVSFIYTN